MEHNLFKHRKENRLFDLKQNSYFIKTSQISNKNIILVRSGEAAWVKNMGPNLELVLFTPTT